MTDKKKPRLIYTLLYTLFLVIALTFVSIQYMHRSKQSDLAILADNSVYDFTSNETINLAYEKPEKMAIITPIPKKNILLGKARSAIRDSLMVSVAPGFGNHDGLLMHREAWSAFIEMHQAAQQDGIKLTIISAYRNFDHQKRIWENKWNGRQILSGNIKATDIEDPVERAREILRFSAMPGTSRHHWGTDIDINSLNNAYFNSGNGKVEYEWLQKNASKYGFCQPYNPLSERNNTGYEEEKWHWSYMPVAAVYLQSYNDSVTYQYIKGFDGWETAEKLNIIKNYVMAINEYCIDFLP